jgi:hypothetical protein
MEFEIIGRRPGNSGQMDSTGNYELEFLDFQVVLPWVPGDLPECLPGSRAVNAEYRKNPLATDAALYIKKNDGTWL